MTIKLDARALTDALVKLQKATEQLPQLAAQVEGEALGHAVLGAQASVYSTAPGQYQRTQEYLRGFHSSHQATRHTASVSVWNSTDYAGYIEYGVGPHAMTPAQLLQHIGSNPAQPLYLGRQGADGRYVLPGPAVWPAAYYAAWKLSQMFGDEVRRNLR